jgi:sugar phosphate isomerase/epimerase
LFQLGFSTIGCPDYTIEQVVRLAVETGLRGVEIRFVRGTTDLVSLPEFSPRQLPETRKRFDDAGLQVVAIDTSVHMNSLDPAVRAENLQAAKKYLEIAVALGAPHLRVFGGGIPEGQTKEETREATASGLSEIAELTFAAGVQSLLETHDSYSTSASVTGLFSAGASQHLGILWDSLHTFRHGETAEQSWAALGPRIRHVHVKDSTQADADFFDFALTGEGIVPIPHILGVLRAGGYERYVHFEWEKGWHPEIADPEVAIPHFARYMAARAPSGMSRSRE